MGHERIGALPRSRQWRELVAGISSAADSREALIAVAAGTLHNVRTRFERIAGDSGVQAAFGFLVGLSSSHLPPREGKSSPPVDLSGDPSVLQLVTRLDSWIQEHAQSMEYAELAKRAAADAIAHWTRLRSRQHDLFSPEVHAQDVWHSASTGRAFCEVARAFFSGFLLRYLKYFLERAASAETRSTQERDRFSRRLEEEIDGLSHHAFETSKIAQSFAAGWFNKNARERRPTDEEIAGFLAFAFGKLRQELLREAKE